MTDSQQRYERALVQLAARLGAHQIKSRLVVDDHRGGDRIALVAQARGEHLELSIERHSPERGTAWLLAEGPAAARAFVEATAGIVGKVSRLATVQRGCLVATTIMARNLAMESKAMHRGYPRAGLDDLRRAFGAARPLVGLRAELRPASVVMDSTARELASGLVPVYGAVVPTAHGPRAALWKPADRGFSLPAGARRDLLTRLGSLDRTALAAMAIAGPVAFGLTDDSHNDERSFDPADVADGACDLCELTFCDLGSFDLGSCFDLVPDCSGGLDCVPLDCAF